MCVVCIYICMYVFFEKNIYYYLLLIFLMRPVSKGCMLLYQSVLCLSFQKRHFVHWHNNQEQ